MRVVSYPTFVASPEETESFPGKNITPRIVWIIIPSLRELDWVLIDVPMALLLNASIVIYSHGFIADHK